ncbi:MAG: diguanylate cyclase [Leptolyngbya sp. SIOISBB]|nr:diguanylate cyclase [Leptolyngbya sp. SIOISBB]
MSVRHWITFLSKEQLSQEKRLSLRLILSIPFLVQIVVAVSLTGYFSWLNGQKTVRNIAQRLSQEVAKNIENQVSSYTEISSQFLLTTQAAYESGNLGFADQESLARYFWKQTQVSEAIPFIYFGSAEGDYIGVWSNPEDVNTLQLQTQSTAPYREIYRLDEQGQVAELLRREEYDPRMRPWYKAAEQAGKQTWSPIYVWATSPRLGIDHAIPIYEKSGLDDTDENSPDSLLGVLSVAVTLSDISVFLQQADVSYATRLFVVEKSGAIVASSAAEAPFINTEMGEQRLLATQSSDFLIRETSRTLHNQLGSFAEVVASQQHFWEIGEEDYFVQIVPFDEQIGLDWLILVVIPRSDFTTYIQANTYITVLLCLVALLITLSIGFTISQWIITLIARLSKASQAIAEQATSQDFGQGEQPIYMKSQSVRELEILARTFNYMAAQLKQSFAQIANVNAELEERVVTRTLELEAANRELKRSASIDGLTQISNRRHFDEFFQQTWRSLAREKLPVSLILCDVDYFKLYNDTYGHQAGDDCLKKVAQAIQTSVQRPSDLVARYGGEEFGVILPQTDLAGAVHVAEKIRAKIGDLKIPHAASAVSEFVTVSIGVGCAVPNPNSAFEILVESTDRVLYRAKAQGRDQIVRCADAGVRPKLG